MGKETERLGRKGVLVREREFSSDLLDPFFFFFCVLMYIEAIETTAIYLCIYSN